MTHFTLNYKNNSHKMRIHNERDHICRNWELNRFIELDLLEKIASLELEGIYLDLGAHMGNHSVFFANYCRCIHLVSIEPQPQIHNILVENLQENVEIPNTIFNLAVGESNEVVKIVNINKLNTGMTRICEEHGVLEVPCHRLDDLGLPEGKIAFIKMDIEGYEDKAMKGGYETIAEHRPYLAVELKNNKAYESFSREIAKHNYQCIGKYAATPTFLWGPRNLT